MSGISRRSFLTGAALSGAAFAGAALTGCAPGETGAAGEAASTDKLASTQAATTWRDAPEQITDDQIEETLEADLVVVGAGNSGCVAAVSGVEDGASVILLQKEAKVISHGDVWAAAGSQVQKDMHVDVDPWEVINDTDLTSENRAKTEVLRNWVKYSGEVADWLTEKINATDLAPVVVAITEDEDDVWNHQYDVLHVMAGAGGRTNTFPDLMQNIVDTADQSKLNVLYSTPGVQLRRGDDGRVTGVVAQREDGSYILCNAAKAVILAAGDYGNDAEMRHEFMPYADVLPSGYSVTSNTGDGIKMGYWIGAEVQPSPHACNIHYDPGITVPNYAGTVVPWLRVNQNGERFSNEDMPYELIYAKDILQPGAMHYQVFDDNYATDVETMGIGGMMRGTWSELVPQALEAGDLHTGNTLEELAESMGVPADTFAATVERYNELCDAGYDEDFGKRAVRLKPVRKAPFYAFARQATCLTPLCGLEVNGDMQVIDQEGNVVDGLYACGNNSGNYFGGLVQRLCTGGMAVGRAVVTGRVAEKRALGIDY